MLTSDKFHETEGVPQLGSTMFSLFGLRIHKVSQPAVHVFFLMKYEKCTVYNYRSLTYNQLWFICIFHMPVSFLCYKRFF